MSIEDSDAALRIVEAGRQRVLARMREAFAHQAATHADLGELDPTVLDRLVHEAAEQAGTSVWRIALAEGAADEYGVEIGEALEHPAVAAAERLVGPVEQPGVPPAGPAYDSSVSSYEPATPSYESPAPEAAADTSAGAQGEDDVYDPWGLGEQSDTGAQDEEPPQAGGESEPAPEPEPADQPADEPVYEPPTGVHEPADEVDAPEPMEEPEPELEAMDEPEPADTPYGAQDAPEPEPELDREPEPAAESEPTSEPEPATEPAAADTDSDGQAQALRIPAVHTSGIETLKQGDKDLELRLSDAGLDVLRHSTGVAIGRLDWGEITSVEVEAVKKGLRGRKVSQTLQVKTSRGQATFELPGLTDEESSEHLQPMLDRLRSAGVLAADPS